MKPLDNLNNVEKAKLLHELFPSEIPALLKYIAAMSVTIEEQQEPLKATWEDQIISFNFWLELARGAEKKVIQYGVRLEKSSRLFADQLFDGYASLYMGHCLYQYTKTQRHSNKKFAIAIEMLFGFTETI